MSAACDELVVSKTQCALQVQMPGRYVKISHQNINQQSINHQSSINQPSVISMCTYIYLFIHLNLATLKQEPSAGCPCL